jgi:hypothetical protein
MKKTEVVRADSQSKERFKIPVEEVDKVVPVPTPIPPDWNHLLRILRGDK